MKRFPLVLVLLVLISLLIVWGAVSNQPSKNNQLETHIESLPIRTPQSIVSITKPADRQGWVTYTNSKYGYSIDVPKGSSITSEDYDNYTRIQNYDRHRPYVKGGGLNKNEYYLELRTYDLDSKDSYLCIDQIVAPKEVNKTNLTGYKGKLKPGGGESARSRIGLCAQNEETNFDLVVSEDINNVAEDIIDTFRIDPLN